MAKLTFHVNDELVEFEGTVEEVTAFLKTIQKEHISLVSDEEHRRRLEELARDKAEVENAKKSLPTIKAVKAFILSQPEYRHTTFEVEKHFFGRTFKARGVSEGLYHEFLHITTEARRQIEREHNGKFNYELELGRHKVYTWKSA